MIKLFFKTMFLLSLGSCSHDYVINKSKHEFERSAQKIVWLQIPGLDHSHFAYLKMINKGSNKQVAPELATCIGREWNYSFYQLRTNERSSLLAELTESKDIKNNCEDYKKTPFWNRLAKTNIKMGNLVLDNHLSKDKACRSEKNEFYAQMIRWKMDKKSEPGEVFHKEMNKDYKRGNTYYDVSCKSGKCYTSLEENAQALFQNFYSKSSRYIFLIQDFSLAESLKKKKFQNFSKKMERIDNLLRFFFYEADKDPDLLILISSGSSLPIELPEQGGKFWKNKKNIGKFVSYKRSSLSSPIIAKGAGAERFCGYLEASELVKRTY